MGIVHYWVPFAESVQLNRLISLCGLLATSWWKVINENPWGAISQYQKHWNRFGLNNGLNCLAYFFAQIFKISHFATSKTAIISYRPLPASTSHPDDTPRRRSVNDYRQAISLNLPPEPNFDFLISLLSVQNPHAGVFSQINPPQMKS